MTPADHLQTFAASKLLYSACLEPVCRKYGLNRTELDILLFLANNPQYDTAADICAVRSLAKSHVSTSVRALEGAGFLEKYQLPADRRVIHLRVLPAAEAAIADGRAAQERFCGVLTAGLTPEELHALERASAAVMRNVRKFMEGSNVC